MISDVYKQIYSGATVSCKQKESAIMSNLKKVQNEICAEILHKLHEPTRKRTLSKTPEKKTIEAIRKSLNVDSQNHKINSQNQIDYSPKEFNNFKPCSITSASYGTNFSKTPQTQKHQKISFSLSNRSQSPQYLSLDKTKTKTISNAFVSEEKNNSNKESNYKQGYYSNVPQSPLSPLKVQDEAHNNLNDLTKEQMKLLYEQEKKKNQQQLDNMVQSNQQILQSHLDEINKFFVQDSDDFLSLSILPANENSKSNQQFDSRLTTSESQGEYQKTLNNGQNLSQKLHKLLLQTESPQNNSPQKLKQELNTDKKYDLSKEKSSKNQQNFVSFRKNSKSPISRNAQQRNSKSPAYSNNKNMQSQINQQRLTQPSSQNLRSKQVSFSQDIFVVEKQNIPKTQDDDLNSLNQNIFEKSSIELQKQYEQHLKTNPADQQQKAEFEELLSLIKKEKAIILNEIQYLIEQRNKYKYLYNEQLQKNSLEEQQPKQNQDVTKTQAFKKVMNYLDNTSFNTGNFLKVQQSKLDQFDQIISTIKNKDEVIHVQKLVISKLLNQLSQK
ncbi:hypothetical protein ABPG72_010365 [Tetrahymena utriculariae]